MKTIFKILFCIFVTTLSGCSNIQINDERKDEYFLRKKYCLTRIYFSDSDVELSNYINPESIGIDTKNTFMDFYYGGIDFYNDNGPLFVVQFKCNSSSDRNNTVVKDVTEIDKTIGSYTIRRNTNYDYVLYYDFKDADKHLNKSSFDSNSKMYKGSAFPEYYVRCEYILNFIDNGKASSKPAILEFGNPVLVHDVNDTPF